MLLTYPAILRAGKLEWGADGPPPALSDAPVPVHVTLLTNSPRAPTSGATMLAALEAAAAAGAAEIFGDPIDWQREQRMDRKLAGRDE